MAAANRYTTVAIALHWLIAAAIVLQILGGWRMEDLEGAEKFEAFQVHKSAGITILLLSLVRLGWRLANPPPPLPDGMKPWEIMAAKLTHVGFYALMIGIPIGGWIIISTSPYSVTTMVWGLFEWPKLPLGDLPFKKALNEIAKSGHSAAAWATIGLLGLHVGAVLKHAFVNKDDVPGRMLPFLRAK
jgi:cytochrome b561